MYRHSNEYFIRAKLAKSKRLPKLLSYIRENPWCSNYDVFAKRACKYPICAMPERTTMSLHMTKLWLEGKVEGISFGNNKWEYIAVDYTK